ncbi:hypothetical protein [Pontibacter chinhatensis]|uniref:hypothetical protein n=1 Tax=Pontibacter chinhatensis TaxID=1436961 RepID=UPI0015876E61|nr:hypothetical protein [Pontibacter chinhatensis]
MSDLQSDWLAEPYFCAQAILFILRLYFILSLAQASACAILYLPVYTFIAPASRNWN